MKPTGLASRMRKHNGDALSESDRAQPFAKRTVLGKRVKFYTTGEHVVSRTDLSDDEQYNSELMRFCHASLLTGQPVGDKKVLWVDASTNPVQVWLFGQTAEDFCNTTKDAIRMGSVASDLVVDGDPILTIRSLDHE